MLVSKTEGSTISNLPTHSLSEQMRLRDHPLSFEWNQSLIESTGSCGYLEF